MSTTQVIDLKYFASIESYKKLVNRKYAEIPSYLTYQKSLYLNRAVIAGANGQIKLTIPLLKGRNQRSPIHNVQVAYDENWRKDHWKAILSSYNKSPWFEHYHDIMAAFYLNQFERLIEWNHESLNIINRILGVNIIITVGNNPPVLTQPFEPSDHHIEKPEKQQVEIPKPYPQVFDDRFGFQPNLSILDLLFCLGPREAMVYLTST